MSGLQEAAEPGAAVVAQPAVAAPVAAPAATTSTVQDAVEAAVAAYRTKLETSIKASLGIATPAAAAATAATATPGFFSRALSDAEAAAVDLGGGTKTIGTDFSSVIKGRPMQVQNSTGGETNVPRWLVYVGTALAVVGAGFLGDLALHALHVL